MYCIRPMYYYDSSTKTIFNSHIFLDLFTRRYILFRTLYVSKSHKIDSVCTPTSLVAKEDVAGLYAVILKFCKTSPKSCLVSQQI